MPRSVGVVAIQGDFEKHMAALRRCAGEKLPIRRLRTAEDLAGVDRAIIPGGESTTVGLLLRRFGLGDALVQAGAKGMPIWGTCMGMILLAKDIVGYPDQYKLGLLDISVERNAFGAQVHSFEAQIPVSLFERPLTAVFIRAPVAARLGPGVEPIAEFEGHVVGVRQRNLLATSFHPELTNDTRFHEWFLGM